MGGIAVVVAGVEVDDSVVEEDKLELVVVGEDVDDEGETVDEEVDFVLEDEVKVHWPSWQL